MGWMERTVNAGFACGPFFKVDPHLATLRELPEFQRLVAGLERTHSALRSNGCSTRGKFAVPAANKSKLPSGTANAKPASG
jgi:hypothetical protein